MMRYVKTICVLLPLFVLSKSVYSTGQYGDLLIVGKDTVQIFSNPLESYFEQRKSRSFGGSEMGSNCTALWRGYVATWKIENDSLFLVRVQTDYCSDNKIEIDVAREFGKKIVYAYWVNSTLIRPKGRLLQYVHMGYASIYEGEVYYQVKNGKLVKMEEKKFLKKQKNEVIPDERFLEDTIKKMILSKITREQKEKFEDDDRCNLYISFGTTRLINKVGFSYHKEPENELDEVILKAARSVLKNFPRIMHVDHPMYRIPELSISFDGYCVKFPKDKKYGCYGY